MSLGEIECGACGLSLGLGAPGTSHWCARCAGYAISRAERDDFGGVLSAIFAVGVGLLIVFILLALFGGRR